MNATRDTDVVIRSSVCHTLVLCENG